MFTAVRADAETAIVTNYLDDGMTHISVADAEQFRQLLEQSPSWTPWVPFMFDTFTILWIDFAKLPKELDHLPQHAGADWNGVRLRPLQVIRELDKLEDEFWGPFWAVKWTWPADERFLKDYGDAIAARFKLAEYTDAARQKLIQQGFWNLQTRQLTLAVWVGNAADRATYEKNLMTEPEPVASPPTPAAGHDGGSGSMMLMGGGSCSITNDAEPFRVLEIVADTNGCVAVTWESCSDHLYRVWSAEEMASPTVWTARVFVPGEDGSTAWMDDESAGVEARFYRVQRLTFTGDDDGDGLANLEEYQLGTDPGLADTDGDGMADGWEAEHGLDPRDANDAAADNDGDGSTSLEEFLAGTDPNDWNDVPPANSVKVALDRFNYFQVNALETILGWTPTVWNHATNQAARLAVIRSSLTPILTNCLDLVVNQNGVLANTNVVVTWTLASVLSNVHQAASTAWMDGLLTVAQVTEAAAVLDRLTHIPAVSALQAGVVEQTVSFAPDSFLHTNLTVVMGMPATWSASSAVRSYLQFTENMGFAGAVMDDFIKFNSQQLPSGTPCFALTTTNVHEVTGWWVAGTNRVELWDSGFCGGTNNHVYLSPFRVALVLRVPRARFQVAPGKINEGFDPTGVEPWASVGTNAPTEVARLWIDPAADAGAIELVVVSGSVGVSVTPSNEFTQAATVLTIHGGATAGNTVIEARIKGSNVVLDRLNVMVLPTRHLTVGIYRIVDPDRPGTGPVSGQTDESLIASLNEIYRQTWIEFTLVASATNNFIYDANQDDKLQVTEQPVSLATNTWAGQVRVFLFKNSGVAYQGYPNSFVRGFTPDVFGQSLYSVVFSSEMVENTFAHEVGHQLNIPVRDSAPGEHDPGPWPEGEEGLMKSGAPVGNVWPVPTGKWLRQEDWKEANDKAGTK